MNSKQPENNPPTMPEIAWLKSVKSRWWWSLALAMAVLIGVIGYFREHESLTIILALVSAALIGIVIIALRQGVRVQALAAGLAESAAQQNELRRINEKLNQEILQWKLAERQENTAYQQTETALNEQRKQLELLVEATHTGVWEWNVETGETFFNERWAAMVGYTPAELAPIGIQTWKDLCQPEDLKKSNQALLRHFSGELEYYDCEYRIRHKDGHWVWIHDRGKVVKWSQEGKPLYMSGTHTDITSRKRTEAALKESQERLTTAIEALDDGFVLYDADDRLVLCNSRYLEIYKQSAPYIFLGARFEDIIRKGVEQGQYDQAVGREEEWIAERLLQHRSQESTIEQRLANGTWLRIAERQTRDGGVVGFRVDITDLKNVEAQLRQANETLEERVRERTREVEQLHGQMAMQEKMASVGQLAAGIAHELNNPINFIRTNFATLTENFTDLIEVLQDYHRMAGGDDALYDPTGRFQAILAKEESLQIDYILEDIPDLFSESERGFERIARIIQSMRDFSYVDHTGSLTYYNLNKGIEDTLVITKNVYKYHADVETDLGDLPEILCLPEQINQVLLNLVVNSAQAIGEKPGGDKGVITIRTWREGDHVCCQITDNGPGIPSEIRSRVFEPFFTTKAPGKGTGLGLSISYDIIVNKHRGKLVADCPETGGTVFTISLPVDAQPKESTDENSR